MGFRGIVRRVAVVAVVGVVALAMAGLPAQADDEEFYNDPIGSGPAELFGGTCTSGNTKTLTGARDTKQYGDGTQCIHAEGGPDDIETGGGDDKMWGANGNDTLNGEAGKDGIQGESDDDTLDGGAATDQVKGSANSDIVRGGEGDDLLWDGPGIDHVYGGAGTGDKWYQSDCPGNQTFNAVEIIVSAPGC